MVCLFFHESKTYIYRCPESFCTMYAVLCELFFFSWHLTSKAILNGNKMIQKRFVKGLTEKRENWKNSAGSFRVYSFNYLHFPLAVLPFRFLGWESSDTNFRSFWHYKLSHFHAAPLTNPYKCSTVILNYSFVVIKVELVHSTDSDSEKEGSVAGWGFKNCSSDRWGSRRNEV